MWFLNSDCCWGFVNVFICSLISNNCHTLWADHTIIELSDIALACISTTSCNNSIFIVIQVSHGNRIFFFLEDMVIVSKY